MVDSWFNGNEEIYKNDVDDEETMNKQKKQTRTQDTRYYLVRVFYGAPILRARFFIPTIAPPVANGRIQNVPNRFLNNATWIKTFQKIAPLVVMLLDEQAHNNIVNILQYQLPEIQ